MYCRFAAAAAAAVVVVVVVVVAVVAAAAAAAVAPVPDRRVVSKQTSEDRHWRNCCQRSVDIGSATDKSDDSRLGSTTLPPTV